MSRLHIPCCIDVPEEFESKARYGIEMLLLPYRAEARWVSENELSDGGLYYGVRPDSAPSGAYRIGLAAESLSFFTSRTSEVPSERQVAIGGHELPVLFESSGDAPVDLVAAAFYFVAGWQEMILKERDEHGRFPFTASIQHRFSLALVPVVELYRALFKQELGRRGFQLESKMWAGDSWAFCATHDIDYVKKWRPGIVRREIVQRAVQNADRESAGERVRRIGATLLGLAGPSDPYSRAIIRIRNEVSVRNGRATYFFKTASRGPRDVSYDPSGKFLQQQYRELRNNDFEIGLHPSYHAFNHGRYLREEYDQLRRSSGIDAVSVRTHYLRFDPVYTPRLLAETGFEIDSSLGFATHEGFRRGTALPFPLYDLVRDEGLDIWEMALLVMESTLFNRRNMDVGAAIEATQQIMETCKTYNGVFVGLWHNLLWDEMDFPGWAEHFLACLDHAKARDARMTSLQSALSTWK